MGKLEKNCPEFLKNSWLQIKVDKDHEKVFEFNLNENNFDPLKYSTIILRIIIQKVKVNWFNGTSTLGVYLMPNHVYRYTYTYISYMIF